jgi:hypothetical protein
MVPLTTAGPYSAAATALDSTGIGAERADKTRTAVG